MAEAGRLHAQTAVVAELARELDACSGWRGRGMRSCADYLVVELGFDRHTADVLLRAGRAAVELPQVGEAFAAGELSLDKMRSISTIATPVDQEKWVAAARVSSAPQLQKRAREERNAQLTDAPARARAQRAQRGLRLWWDEGMLRLSGAMPPEEGKTIQLAVEAARKAQPELPLDDPAENRRDAADADALAALCRAALDGEPGIREALAAGEDDRPRRPGRPDRCHAERARSSRGWPALSTATLRRMGCDASVVTMTERDGLPIDRGREQQIISPAIREAVHSRDRICQFPGCAMPASRSEVHHNIPIYWNGPARMWNLVTLCRFHHGRVHDDVDICWGSDGNLTFATPDRQVIGRTTLGAWKRPREFIWS